MSELTYQPYDRAGNQYGRLTPNQPPAPIQAPACLTCLDKGMVAVVCRDNRCMAMHIRSCGCVEQIRGRRG